jgi:hypothetical protein
MVSLLFFQLQFSLFSLTLISQFTLFFALSLPLSRFALDYLEGVLHLLPLNGHRDPHGQHRVGDNRTSKLTNLPCYLTDMYYFLNPSLFLSSLGCS